MNIRRYSVVGNDSSFKAYTRDYSFTIGNSASGRPLEDAVLKVSVKEFKQEGDKDGSRE